MTVAFNSELTSANLNAKLISRTDNQTASGIIDFTNSIKIDGTEILDLILGVPRPILFSFGSHGGASNPAAGKYLLNISQASSSDLVLSGDETSTARAIIRLDSTEFPDVKDLSPKFKIRAVLNANDVASTSDWTIGLYPVTRPASSGGTVSCIYTLGTVVTDSTVLFTAPAADSQAHGTSTIFDLPTAGYYMLGVETSATMAASSIVQITATLYLEYQ